MSKFLKFGYYNIALGFVLWLILFIYKINIWLAVFGSIFIIYLLYTLVVVRYKTYKSDQYYFNPIKVLQNAKNKR